MDVSKLRRGRPSHTPRSMRLRRRAGRPGVAMAASPTSRALVGPWAGPFEPFEAAPSFGCGSPFEGCEVHLPATIFLDDRGGAHLAMKPTDDLRLSRSLSKSQEAAGLLSGLIDGALAAAARRNLTEVQARRHGAAAFARSASAEKLPAKAAQAVRRERRLEQPRRSCY